MERTIVPECELHVIVIGGTFSINVGDFVIARGVRRPVRIRDSASGHVSGSGCPGSTPPPVMPVCEALSLPIISMIDVMQLVGVGDVRKQGFVGSFSGSPIHAMHLRIVETILHHPPGFLENLPALGRSIDLHADGERDSPRRGSSLAAAIRRPGLSSAPALRRPHRCPRRLPVRRLPRAPKKCRRPARSKECARLWTIAAGRIRRVRRLRRPLFGRRASSANHPRNACSPRLAPMIPARRSAGLSGDGFTLGT